MLWPWAHVLVKERERERRTGLTEMATPFRARPTRQRQRGGEGDSDRWGDRRDARTGEREAWLVGVGYADGVGPRW